MKNSNKDYYQILGVDKKAAADAIKKAYRKLAMKYHPDQNQGDKDAEAKFKEIAEAYDVLSDPNKRKNYDNGGFSFFGNFGSNPFDIFNSAFGGGNPFGGFRTNSRQVVGPDNKIALRVSLAQIITGATAVIEFNRFLACEDCMGQGSATTDEQCKACGGNGQLQSNMANMVFVTTCPNCSGTGKKREVCKKCNGAAYTSVKEKEKLEIPKGTIPHTLLKIPNKGNEIYHNGNKIIGSTWVVVDYTGSEKGVSVNRGNIYASAMVPFNTIMAEEQIKIDVLGCKNIEFKLDSTKESGYQYQIKGSGVTEDNDAFVKVFIDSPKNKLSEEDKEKLNKVMGEIYGKPTKQFGIINNHS